MGSEMCIRDSLNVSSEAANQVWLAANGLWSLVVHAFSPVSDQSGRLAASTLTNLAMNGANKPLMYRAELRLKTATWQALVRPANSSVPPPMELVTVVEAASANKEAAFSLSASAIGSPSPRSGLMSARSSRPGTSQFGGGTTPRGGGPELDADAAMVANAIREASQSCLLYTSPSPRDGLLSRMPSSA